jgi:hypothetical protein
MKKTLLNMLQKQAEHASDLVEELTLGKEMDPVRLEMLAGQVLAENERLYKMIDDAPDGILPMEITFTQTV